MTALFSVHDLWRAELMYRLVQCFKVEVRLQRVGDALGPNLAGELNCSGFAGG
jgi:hypothetical protein